LARTAAAQRRRRATRCAGSAWPDDAGGPCTAVRVAPGTGRDRL